MQSTAAPRASKMTVARGKPPAAARCNAVSPRPLVAAMSAPGGGREGGGGGLMVGNVRGL